MKKLIAAVLVAAAAAACDGGPTEPEIVTEDRGYALRLESREVKKPANVSILFQVRTSAGQVDLATPSRTGGALNLDTSSGAIAVRTEVDVEIMNRNRLTGRLGGSGRSHGLGA